MEYQIDLRPFQPEDQEALAGVIRRTWQYDRFCGPKTAQRLGRVYLRQCLTQQTFTRVAVVNGVPVGIIMGKNERTHRCPWSLRWRAARAVLALLATREGRKVARLFSGVERINQALLSRCPQSYPGQVAFCGRFPVCSHQVLWYRYRRPNGKGWCQDRLNAADDI